MKQEEKNYIRIPFNNAFINLPHKIEFERRLDILERRLQGVAIKRLWLNHVEMLDVPNTMSCIKSMSVNQVIKSELLIEVLPCL